MNSQPWWKLALCLIEVLFAWPYLFLPLYALNLWEWMFRERIGIDLISPSIKTNPESLVWHLCTLFSLGHLIQTSKIFFSILSLYLWELLCLVPYTRSLQFGQILKEWWLVWWLDSAGMKLHALHSYWSWTCSWNYLCLNWSLFLLWATLLTYIYDITLFHVTITEWHNFIKDHWGLWELLLEIWTKFIWELSYYEKGVQFQTFIGL